MPECLLDLEDDLAIASRLKHFPAIVRISETGTVIDVKPMPDR